MSIFNQIAEKIIEEQEQVIGPMAWQEAQKVQGLQVNRSAGKVEIAGNESEVINGLVAQYERLFGRASREVCKDAAASLVTGLEPNQIPSSLK